jgi:hypothetical protein
MKKLILIVVVILAISGAGIYLTQEPNPEDITAELVALMEAGDIEGAERLLAQSAEDNMNGSITVSGRVQDGNGNPLSNVNLSSLETHLAVVAEDAYSNSTDSIINGEFRLQCGDCSAISADFTKEGYYSADKEWFAFAPGSGGIAVRENNIVVTMRVRGVPAQLDTFRGEIESGSTESVLAFSFDTSGEVMELVESTETTSELTPYIQLQTALEADGSISLEQVTAPGGNFPIDRPRQAQLRLFGEGGFIPYETEEIQIRRVEQEMSLAPATGYTDSLEIGRQDYLPQYFYCMIENRFCRGRVESEGAQWLPNTQRARVRVNIDINLSEGDRNLTPRF